MNVTMKKKKRYGKKVFLLILILIAVTFFYAFRIEPNRLQVHAHTLKKQNSTETETIRIAQFSDTHIGKFYSEQQLQKAVDKINEQKPDIIVFTGDLFDNYSTYGTYEKVIPILEQLDAKYGKFAIWGNRDYGGGASRVYEQTMEESGFILLNNSGNCIITEKNKKLYIGGVDDAIFGFPNIELTLEEKESDTDYTIVLGHEPDKAKEYETSEIDLILAGHSHGGQVKIPFLHLVTTRLAKYYIEGFYTLDKGGLLFVNTGLGMTRIPVRFGVVPTIDLFEISV